MKGVSSIMATILMVAVTIAAAVVAYSWLMSLQASVQAEASRGAGAIGKERITVTAVKCDKSTNNLTVYVRNLGNERIDGNFTVIVEDASTGIVLDNQTVSGDIPVGGETKLVVEAVSGLSDCLVSDTGSESVIVKVVTPGGTVASKEQRIGVKQ